jgi:eukaryotic-like serine/threonine-protein kinase
MTESEMHRCNTCGDVLPFDAPEGACVACMLRAALVPDTRPPPDGSAGEDVTLGFEPVRPGHVLESLARSIGPIPRVLLPDTAPDDTGAGIIQSSSDEMRVPTERGDRYQLFGEIARGGMGAVLRGRDPDLGRDLAVKVLLESHEDKPEMLRRFVEEAQIGGQLQHPGIVPVYELGAFADRRPYFTMKLVKGRTLSALLSERQSPAHDLPRFLAIFEAICQTVAYAHARGVIHRDLKPSNVMVGSFGEVQVMDWGLAKVLKEGGVAGEAPAPPAPEESLVATVRSGSNLDESQAGSVLGTPAYMAPEQAGGDVGHVDRRADVFGLGSILCEVLTGRPAFTGSGVIEVLRKAMAGDTVDALARLDVCGSEAELIALARDCLAVKPEDRPRDAGLVAERMTTYLAGVQTRVQAAERERAVAVATAIEERRRRKVQLALAASVLALSTLGGLSTTYYLQQRAAQAAAGQRVIDQVTTLEGQALANPEEIGRWEIALAAARQADPAGDPRTKAQLLALQKKMQTGLAAAKKDKALLDRLVDIRSAEADDWDGLDTDAAYIEAFREAGIDLADMSPALAGAKIKARPASVALALAAALDDWAAIRRGLRADAAGAARLSEAARAADPDPWRTELRIALDQSDKAARLTSLRNLAKAAQADEAGAIGMHLLGIGLNNASDRTRAESVLRSAQQWYPRDVWVNYALGRVLETLSRRDEAIRFYTAARSIRPETAHELAHALEKRGESDEAIAVFRDLKRLRPGNARHLGCLGKALKTKGLSREADETFDAAVAAGREAIRLKPEVAANHGSLGVALWGQGKLDEAIAELRTAIRLQPNNASGHFSLGYALKNHGKLDEAIAEYRTAIRLQPDLSDHHNDLGIALRDQGKLDEAIAEHRTAIRLQPNDAMAHTSLGIALRIQGKLDEAIAEYRAAILLKPDLALAHTNLGTTLQTRGKVDLAITEFRTAIRLQPDDAAAAHCNLGKALADRGKADEATAEYRAAIRLEPDMALAHMNLGVTLRDQGKLDLAMAEFRTAIRLEPDLSLGHMNLGLALRDQGKLEEAMAEYRTAIRLKPDLSLGHMNLGLALRDQGKLDAAMVEFRAAIRIEPDLAVAHMNLGLSLQDRGMLDLAMAEYRTAIRLEPNDAMAHTNLGIALRTQGKLDEAVAEHRAAIRLQPNDAVAHTFLGVALAVEGKLDDGIAEHRAAILLKPDLAVAHTNLGITLQIQGKLDLAMAEFRTSIRLKPDDAGVTHHNLGNALRDQGKLDEAMAEYRAAIRLKPDLAPAHMSLGVTLRDQGKLAEAMAEYRTAIRLNPGLLEAHFNFGVALRAQGKLEEALASFRRAGELASPGSPIAQSISKEITRVEKQIALSGRLPAILRGDDKPADNPERLAFAQLCYDQGLYTAAARLWAEALAGDPKLGDDRQAQHRYNAACAAALAAAGQGKAEPPPDDAAKARLRQQALDWLKAELATWTKLLESGPPQARQAIVQTLDHWKKDSDLVGIREAKALAKLPADEQKAWRTLWADVDSLRERAATPKAAETDGGKQSRTGAAELPKPGEAEPLLHNALEQACLQFGPADPRTAGPITEMSFLVSFSPDSRWLISSTAVSPSHRYHF